MDSILIDYTNIILTHNLKNLINYFSKICPIPKPLYPNLIGVILIIPTIIKSKLKEYKITKNKLEYINTFDFIKNIKKFYFIIINNNYSLCEILYTFSLFSYINSIFKTLFFYFKSNMTLWIRININTDINIISNKLIKNEFNHPYISQYSPLGHKFNSFGICLFKTNQPYSCKPIQKSSINNEILYLIKQYNNPSLMCNFYIQFTSLTISILEQLVHNGKNNKKISQKELGGSLYIDKIIPTHNYQCKKDNNKQFIFIISIDKTSIESGIKEEVKISPSRFNFHSHPVQAYINHKTSNGWPSVHDFVGFLNLKNTIFHCVSTIEGLYIISFNKLLPFPLERSVHGLSQKLNNDKEQKRKISFIKLNYNIDHNNNISPEEFVIKINNILYPNNKNSKPIFYIQFCKWNKCKNKIFEVFYSKTNDSCIPSDNSFDLLNIFQ
jgi:hypothetical protein